MGGSSKFDLIIQELEKQQQRLQEMLTENRQLHQQLTELRAGKAIFLDIQGIRVPLTVHYNVPSDALPVPEPAETIEQPAAPATIQQETTAQSTEQLEETKAAPEQQQSQVVQIQQTAEPSKQDTSTGTHKPIKQEQPSFLEEMMLDEFASALTSPLRAQQAKLAASKKSEADQQAEIRKQLINSYILE